MWDESGKTHRSKMASTSGLCPTTSGKERPSMPFRLAKSWFRVCGRSAAPVGVLVALSVLATATAQAAMVVTPVNFGQNYYAVTYSGLATPPPTGNAFFD